MVVVVTGTIVEIVISEVTTEVTEKERVAVTVLYRISMLIVFETAKMGTYDVAGVTVVLKYEEQSWVATMVGNAVFLTARCLS